MTPGARFPRPERMETDMGYSRMAPARPGFSSSAAFSLFSARAHQQVRPPGDAGEYYADCYQPIADLRGAEKQFNTSMLMTRPSAPSWARWWARARPTNPKAPLPGHTIGAGVVGYLIARYNDERDGRVRLASCARDLKTDVGPSTA